MEGGGGCVPGKRVGWSELGKLSVAMRCLSGGNGAEVCRNS